MGLDTLYVETPEGHPLCLWALDRTARTRTHTHFCTHITVEALKHRHKTDFTCHRMRHTYSNKNIAEHMQITNQVRNGIKDFKEYTLSWKTAMDYKLVKPAYYANGMFAVDERSAFMLKVM